MRLVKWTDESGLKHQSFIKDNEPNSMASEGIPNDPPSLDSLDWDEIKRVIHNRLIDQDITSWQDIQRHQNAITSIVNSTLKSYIVALFRSAERSNENE